MIAFEFDEEESQAKMKKHGIDFYAARDLRDAPDLIEIKAKSKDEPRFLVIGRIGSKHWSAVVTYRNESAQK